MHFRYPVRLALSAGTLGFFLLLAVGSSDSGGGGASSSPPPTHDWAGAYTVCQQFTEQRLKAPSTADWPFGAGRESTQHLGNGKYRVQTYVDAQNSFGAMLRNQVDCTVQWQEGGSWSLENLVIQ